jgi:hypothetical protein
MPVYIYHNTATDEYSEVFQGMNDLHVYSGINGDEDSWKRVFTVPNASIDSHVDPFSSKQFVDKTQNKKGTYGDLLDRSAEMSDKRASLAGGKDPVKEKYFTDYSAKRRGAKHPDQMKTFENSKIKVDFGKK